MKNKGFEHTENDTIAKARCREYGDSARWFWIIKNEGKLYAGTIYRRIKDASALSPDDISKLENHAGLEVRFQKRDGQELSLS